MVSKIKTANFEVNCAALLYFVQELEIGQGMSFVCLPEIAF